MPTYEYRCVECRKPFEIVRPISMNRPKPVRCPKCESRKVERRYSRVFVETSRKS